MATSADGKFDPMKQFKIETISEFAPAGFQLDFTNSALWMVLASGAVILLMTAGTLRASLVPGRIQSLAEMAYQFAGGLLLDNVGSKGKPYLPLVFALFMYILFGNLFGMLPYSFTFTSHIAVTFSMAMFIFIMVTVIGLVRHGTHFFSLFVPKDVPLPILFLLVPIEIISYLSRPISLSVRLFANMMAGHTLLKVIASFVPQMFIFGVLPLALVVALTGLEILIAFLQAYVFAILTCMYINDAENLH